MTHKRKLSIVLLLILMISISCKQENKKDTGKKLETTIPVNVMNLGKINIPELYEYPVNLEAEKEVYYSPATPARIEKILVEVGDVIEKGQLLVEMDNSQYFQANEQLKKLKGDYERVKQLRKTNSISKQVFEATETAYFVAQKNTDFLKKNTELRAPFSGIVTGRFYENGEMYTGSPNPTTGKAAILSLQKMDFIEAEVYVTESLFTKINKKSKVRLKVKAIPNKIFTGFIDIIHPTIDKQSRTFTIKVKIPNQDRTLRSGMSGTIEINLGNSEVMAVPTLSILKLQGSNTRYVFRVENNKAKFVEVFLGRSYESFTEINSDKLNIGDKIIVTGQSKLKSGSSITIKD